MNEWSKELTEREMKEIAFAQIYHNQFDHGTDGHNRLILISKLVALLDKGYGKPVPFVVAISDDSVNPRKGWGHA